MNIELHKQPVSSPQHLPEIELVKLRIAVKWRRPYSIPGAVIANVLRGAIGITFRKLVCPQQFFHDECHPCPLYRDCAYGQIFAPTPPPDAEQLRFQQDLPKPFVIEPPGLNPDEPFSFERLAFQLVLFGSAIDWLPFFITTIERLGWDGMGRDRMPFDIVSVTTEHPTICETLFTQGETTLHLPQHRITTPDLASLPHQGGPGGVRASSNQSTPQVPPTKSPIPAERSDASDPPLDKGGSGGVGGSFDVASSIRDIAPNLAPPLTKGGQGGLSTTPGVPSTTDPNPLRQRLADRRIRSEADPTRPRIKLLFRTPMLLKTGSHKDDSGRIIPAREVRDRPPFGVIVRRLRDRLSVLCLFFGQSPWNHPDFAGLGHRADLVPLIHSNTVWLTRQRTSTRTGQSHEISGFIGEATYEFPNLESFNEFWPLLQIAQHLHLGKNAPWGNGAIEAIPLEGTNP